jgi:hypothetical protein
MPDKVTFDGTSLTGGGDCPQTPGEIPASVKLSVTGPDPYTTRNWYATVEKTARGVRVS